MSPKDLSHDPHAARSFALQLLNRRDHCRAEMVLKLIRQGFDRTLAAETIAELSAEGVVNDERYIENFIAYQVGQGFGPLRIGYKLRAPNLELDPEQVERALSDERVWAQRAAEVREKKFGPERPTEYRDQVKQAYFLQHRGFTAAQIRLALGTDIQIDDWK